MVCPLCDTDLSQDGGLLELIADGTHEIARATYRQVVSCNNQMFIIIFDSVFCKISSLLYLTLFPYYSFSHSLTLSSYLAFHPEIGFPIVAEAVEFSRGQIALYGTRAVWIRAKEVEGLLLRKTEMENLLNTRLHELTMKTSEALEMTSKLQSKQTECEDLKRRLANANIAFSGVTGKSLPSMIPLQQQQQQQRYPQQQGAFGSGGGDMTPRRVSSPSAAMGGSNILKGSGGGGSGGGGGGRGIFNPSHATRAPTPDKSLSVRTSTGSQLNLIRPPTAAGSAQQKSGHM